MQNANFVQEQRHVLTLKLFIQVWKLFDFNPRKTCDNNSNKITLQVNDLTKEGINVEN